MALSVAMVLSGLGIGDFYDDLKGMYKQGEEVVSPVPPSDQGSESGDSGIELVSLENVNKIIDTMSDFGSKDEKRPDSTEPLVELLYTLSPPTVPKKMVIYSSRDILDLGANMSQWQFHNPPVIEYSVENFFVSRSQMSRVLGAYPPAHIMTKCRYCELQIPRYL